MASTIYDKIWDAHAILEGEDGRTLLHVTRHLAHDGSCHAFDFLKSRQLGVRRPDQVFASPDHGVPTQTHVEAAISDPQQRHIINLLAKNASDFGIVHFGIEDTRQGILHVIGPELGLTQPGMVLVCGDSHSPTHGALGALAFGLGTSDVLHVLATQTTWQQRAKRMRIHIAGRLPPTVTAKDVILTIIARIGAHGAAGYVIEYAGPTVQAMSMEERLTLCNMSTESGARSGIIAPDDTAYEYLSNKPFAPKGPRWDEALSYWRTLPSDLDSMFDAELSLDAVHLAPMVTWGNSPENALPVDGRVPDPLAESNPTRRAQLHRTLEYMGLTPGMPMTDIPIDQVFIGSCTNGRLEDLRAASEIVRGRRAVVPALVVPGSTGVKRAAEAEGIDRIFRDAGFTWAESGCSMCVAMNGDEVGSGMHCASTSNRNAVDRQGRGSRTHLVSPAMAAAAALTGHITDVRQLKP